MKQLPDSSTDVEQVGLTRQYIAAVAVMGMLILTGAMIVDFGMRDLANDAEVVNVASRQRMMGQRLANVALVTQTAGTAADRAMARATLLDLSAQFQRDRQWLFDSTRGKLSVLARANSENLQPEFARLIAAAAVVADSSTSSAALPGAVAGLLAVESAFRSRTDSTLSVLGAESAKNVTGARSLMHIVVALVMLGLVGVGWLILRPAVAGIRDGVAHLRRTNAELDVALQEARDAARVKSEFLATMSHELRTPLNAVIGLSGLLMDTRLDDRQKVFASTVNRSGDALLGLINNILDLSKIDAGKLELEVTDFDVRELVESTAETFALRAEGGNVDLATYVTPTLPVLLRGDPGRIRQVLLNLVGNALKFTDGGSVAVRVHNVTGGRVRFEVTDTGIGIPADKIGKLFQPFSQVDASTTRRFGGTGLGLDISRRLVDMMHGTIGVESVEGKGSTFFFELPLAAAALHGREEHQLVLTGKRVLVVDDTAANRLLLREIATGWGMHSEEVEGPKPALDALRDAAGRNEPFDVALVDWQMPGMDGYGLAEAIRNDSTIAQTPLIMLSSFTHQPDADEAAAARFAATVSKPIRQRPLLHALSTALAAAPAGAGRAMASVASSVGASGAAAGGGGGTPGPAPRGTMPRWSGQRVLVADDNPVNVLVLKAMLERHGIRADVAADGEEVLEAVRRTPYALILMDVYMPRLDGLGATRGVREFESANGRPRTPIVACTASVTQDDRNDCIAAGMDDYVSKPVARDILSRVLVQWLGAPVAAA